MLARLLGCLSVFCVLGPVAPGASTVQAPGLAPMPLPPVEWTALRPASCEQDCAKPLEKTAMVLRDRLRRVGGPGSQGRFGRPPAAALSAEGPLVKSEPISFVQEASVPWGSETAVRSLSIAFHPAEFMKSAMTGLALPANAALVGAVHTALPVIRDGGSLPEPVRAKFGAMPDVGLVKGGLIAR